MQIQGLKAKVESLKKLCDEKSKRNHQLMGQITHYKSVANRIPKEKCVICKTTLPVDDMKKHLCRAEDTQINCDYCSQTFQSVNVLDNHLIAFHDEKQFYPCIKCEKKFSMPILLGYHMITHQNEQPGFLCPEPDCGSMFFMQSKLDEHAQSAHAISDPPKDVDDPSKSKLHDFI